MDATIHSNVASIEPGVIQRHFAVTTLAVLDSSQGWSVDNFEGLARHRGLKFFMVSDNNFSALQKTLLVYFEPTGIGDPGTGGNSSEFELRQENPD